MPAVRRKSGRYASHCRYCAAAPFLAHLGDHRVAGHRSKETVDVDRAKRPRERDMLLRRQMLVAKEHDPVFAQGPPDLGQSRLAGRRRKIDPGDLGADVSRKRRYSNTIVGHAHLPSHLWLNPGDVD
jgi:hypothetical protein